MRVFIRFIQWVVAAAAVAAVMFQLAGPSHADAAQGSAGEDAISAGYYHTCALKDGGVRAGATTTTASSATARRQTAARRSR